MSVRTRPGHAAPAFHVDRAAPALNRVNRRAEAAAARKRLYRPRHRLAYAMSLLRVQESPVSRYRALSRPVCSEWLSRYCRSWSAAGWWPVMRMAWSPSPVPTTPQAYSSCTSTCATSSESTISRQPPRLCDARRPPPRPKPRNTGKQPAARPKTSASYAPTSPRPNRLFSRPSMSAPKPATSSPRPR
jgi:hypothetical protein